MANRIFVLIIGLSLVLFIGCSKAPVTEKNNAQESMQAALTAEAEQYAPAAYKVAMDTLNAAKAEEIRQDSKFALLRSYSSAKKLYESAQYLAEDAITQAAAEKERAKGETEKMLISVKAVLDSATTAVAKAPVGKGNKADIELIKADLKAAKSAYDEAMKDVNDGKYLNGQAKLEAVDKKAQAIIGEINKAKAMKTATMKKAK
jgi:hypothetical protein